MAYSTGPTVEGRGEGGKLGEKGVKVMKSVNWEILVVKCKKGDADS